MIKPQKISFLQGVLEPPSYGFLKNGEFYRPTQRELANEFMGRMNVFQSKKNWLPLLGWSLSASLAIPLIIFLTHYFSWPLFFLGLAYGMVAMGSHGTFWLHRYGAHRAFVFRNKFVIWVCRNLVIKIIPEEIYVVSHHVHHRSSEKPGDPYNVHGGWLYCFLSDANHQMIKADFNCADYAQLCKMMNHMGVKLNSHEQYLRYGTLCHPFRTIMHYLLNWAFWFGVFYWMGGPALATALFGFAGVWAFGVRTFNFDGHGRGKDKQKPGVDFHRDDMSINQIWPGFVAGEWHNNHHLFPSGARSGFLSYQLDLPWMLIRTLKWTGAITSYRDYKPEFIRDYHEPFLKNKRLLRVQPTV